MASSAVAWTIRLAPAVSRSASLGFATSAVPGQARRRGRRDVLAGETGEAEGTQTLRGGDAVGVPAAEGVVRVEHAVQLVGRAVHPGGGAVGDGLVHHLPRQDVVPAADALPYVEAALQVDDPLPHPLQ